MDIEDIDGTQLKTIIKEMSLNNQITIKELSEKLKYGATKIKSDIKYLRENKIISRTGSTKSGFWVVEKDM